MRIFSALVMILPILYLFFRIIKKTDLLNPLTLFAAFFVIKVAIPTLILTDETNVSSLITNDYLQASILDNNVFLEYAFLQVVVFFIALLGIRTSIQSGIVNKVATREGRLFEPTNREGGINTYLVLGCGLCCIGIVAFVLMMRAVGGINYFMSNLQMRTTMISSQTTLYWLISLLENVPILLAYYCFKKYPFNRLKIVFLVFFSCILGLMCGLGGRTTLVMILIQIMIIYHYVVKPIDLKSLLQPQFLLLIIGMMAFIVIMPALRNPGEWISFVESPMQYLFKHFSNVFSLITEESYVPHYTAVIKYFSTHNFWHGSSFKGLLTGFIPSSLMTGKPPVDDGMYLYSICLGREDIQPVMSASSLDLSSYPLETFGAMYANFGILGVIVGFWILGRIIGHAYYSMINSEHNKLFYILIYTATIVSFQLSTLRVEQFIISYIKWFVIFEILVRVRIGEVGLYDEQKHS